MVSRTRFVSRPGLNRYAGPSARQLFIARWLPVLLPLVLYGIARAGIHLAALFYLLTALTLFLSARAWLENGNGLGILMLVQLLSTGLALLLLAANVLSPDDWLFYSAMTALMMGYVSFSFNLLASYLPR